MEIRYNVCMDYKDIDIDVASHDMKSATYDNKKMDDASELHNRIKKLYDEMCLLYMEHIIKSQRGTCEKHKNSYHGAIEYSIDPIYCRLEDGLNGEEEFMFLATYFSSCGTLRNNDRGPSYIFMVCNGCYNEMRKLNKNMVSEVEKLLKVDPRADITIYNPSNIHNQIIPTRHSNIQWVSAYSTVDIEQVISDILGYKHFHLESFREDINMKAMGRLAEELAMSGIKHGGVEGSEQSLSFINKLFKAILGN